MKKLSGPFILALLLVSCARTPTANHTPVVGVSIAPLATMARALAGDTVTIVTVVAPGESPATFDPSPRRMAALTSVSLYFACGVPMEHLLLPRLRDSHPGLKVIDTTADLPRLPLDDHDHPQGELDPHLWLNPQLMSAQVMVMAHSLGQLVPGQAPAIQARADSLGVVLADLDHQLQKELAPLKGQDLFVFHPSFGYFAQAYGLRQIAIEQGGLDPSPRHLAQVLEKIKSQGARAVFAQPQFSLGSARAVARETGLPMVVLDPLAPDYVANMLAMSKAIEEAFDDGS